MDAVQAVAPTTERLPVALAERNSVLDVLRGVAMLGIFPVNLTVGFALVAATMFNPPVHGGFTGLNKLSWWVMHLGFEYKMITLFSMLFGAGMAAMDARMQSKSPRPIRVGWSGLYYRRLLVLAGLGLLHAYALWFGDILFTYAVCGLLLYPMLRLSARTLIIIAIPMLAVGMMANGVMALLFWFAKQDPQAWASMAKDFAPTAEHILEETRKRTESYGSLAWWNAGHAIQLQLFIPFWIVWRVLGVMLLGVAAYKIGLLALQQPKQRAWRLMLIGYAVGVPITVAGALDGVRSNFELVRAFSVWMNLNYFGSLFIAAGHIGLVLVIMQAGALPWLQRALASVGRLALTNYLMQTTIAMLLFSAIGFKLFGQLDRLQLWGVVLAVWAIQITFSLVWLNRFDKGPVEWLWRSMTYLRVMPMRGKSGPAAGVE